MTYGRTLSITTRVRRRRKSRRRPNFSAADQFFCRRLFFSAADLFFLPPTFFFLPPTLNLCRRPFVFVPPTLTSAATFKSYAATLESSAATLSKLPFLCSSRPTNQPLLYYSNDYNSYNHNYDYVSSFFFFSDYSSFRILQTTSKARLALALTSFNLTSLGYPPATVLQSKCL